MIDFTNYVIEESEHGRKYLSSYNEIYYSIMQKSEMEWVFEIFKPTGPRLDLSEIICASALEAEKMAHNAIERAKSQLVQDKMIMGRNTDVICVYENSDEYFVIETHDNSSISYVSEFEVFKIVNQNPSKLNCICEAWKRKDKCGESIKGLVVSRNGNDAPKEILPKLVQKYGWHNVFT